MFRTSGKFLIGCNYWGSHAGTHTWRDWRPEVIADDLRLLEEAGVQVIRVFPLWPDFQPLTQLYQCMGEPVEMRFGEQLLPDDELGNAGMSLSAMEHFRFLCDEAEKRHIQVLVGIVTGWMSGRWFVPVPFETKNVLTDPVVLQWELRFVKTFVRYFKDHPAIKGWDLGNECNCLARLNSPQQAYVWTSLIVDAIRSVLDADGRKYVMADVQKSRLKDVERIIPGIGGPTVVNIAGNDDWVAVQAVISGDDSYRVVSDLKKIGAKGILTMPIERLVE